MTTLVRELSDGEELVVEGLIPRNPLDPRERTIAMRRGLVNDDEGSAVVGRPAHAPRTEGLTRLDRDRAASIADEGGTSAATIETERRPKPALPRKERRGPDERRSSVRRGQ